VTPLKFGNDSEDRLVLRIASTEPREDDMTAFWTSVRRTARRFDTWTLQAFNPQYPVGSRS
jgi:hypothetical protein